MIGYSLEETVNEEVEKRPKLFRNLLNIGLSATYLLITFACDLFNKEDPDPVEKVTITNEQPAQGSYTNKHKGDTQKFSFDSNSELGLPLEEFYRVNNIKVDDDNEYTHTFDKGVTTIEGIAKTKEDSSKVEWVYIVENQRLIAIDTTITMLEEGTRTISKNKLINDPDGDETYLNITNTNNVNATINNNGDLEITGLENYFGNASINYSGTDNEATDYGKIDINFTNVADNPKANAGTDKTGTINEEITLDGTNSSHPDNPINNITAYLWKALNDEGNVQITGSDKANATITANTRGNYDIELTVEDNLGATDKDTVNVNINSYKIIINTTNVLNDENISGLEVILANKTAYTDNQGTATLEYPTNISASENLQIRDENIIGDIGEYFNYSENIDITGNKELNIEMVPNVEFNSQFYTDIFDFLKSMTPNVISLTTYTPGEYPENYPIPIDVKESEMPAEHYKQATAEAIELINQTLGWEVYKTTTGDDARYVFDYSKSGSSRFSSEQVQKDGVWYIDNATVYINNNASIYSFEILKGDVTHELFTHGLGWGFHSIDSLDVSNTPVWDSDITQNEKNAMEIYLKLQGGTNLENYEIE